jgi:hypothetical protein
MFVGKLDYYGVPSEHIKQLEEITQGTVNRLFELAQEIYDDKTIDLWNCSVERSVVPVEYEKNKHKRLLITDHSSGWWAVIEFGQPEFCYLENYKDSWDFWLFAAQSDNDNVDPENINWKQFQTEWAYGRADLYWKARRLNNDDPWYSHPHSVSFRHPLLYVMQNAVSKSLAEKIKVIMCDGSQEAG